MKKKQFYEKPAMQVVKLQQKPALLAGSAERSPYGDPIPENWG